MDRSRQGRDRRQDQGPPPSYAPHRTPRPPLRRAEVPPPPPPPEVEIEITRCPRRPGPQGQTRSDWVATAYVRRGGLRIDLYGVLDDTRAAVLESVREWQDHLGPARLEALVARLHEARRRAPARSPAQAP